STIATSDGPPDPAESVRDDRTHPSVRLLAPTPKTLRVVQWWPGRPAGRPSCLQSPRQYDFREVRLTSAAQRGLASARPEPQRADCRASRARMRADVLRWPMVLNPVCGPTRRYEDDRRRWVLGPPAPGTRPARRGARIR